MKSPLTIGHLILIFALGVLPFAATFSLPYPDERHYTDGALQMLSDHDWLVPKTPKDNSTDWQPRFQKPPLAYWLTAASFRAFGVNPLAARMPFLLACCGTIFLTWRLARKLTGNDTTAQLATVIVLSHPQFIFAAARSMPDALLVFFVTLSAFGFLRLIVFQECVAGALWMAYGGAAGAALSKGLLGAGIVVFAWAFAFARERKVRAVKELIHAPSLALAALPVASWFVYIVHRYGAPAWHTFFDDQVTGNLHGGWLGAVWRAPVFMLILTANFLPWSLPALEAWARNGRSPRFSVPGDKLKLGLQPARTFILAWSAALVVGFALGRNVSVRYLLPAAPLLAVVVAETLQDAADAALFCSVRRIFTFMLALLLVLNCGALVINAQWGVSGAMTLVVGLFAATVLALGAGGLWRNWLSANEGVGLALILICPLLFFAVNRVLLPDPTEQLAATLTRMRIDPATPVLFVGRPAMVSGVRLFLGGKCTLVRADKFDPDSAMTFVVALVPESQAGELARRGWELQPAAMIAGAPPAREWWPVLKSRTLPEALERCGGKYLLGMRN